MSAYFRALRIPSYDGAECRSAYAWFYILALKILFVVKTKYSLIFGWILWTKKYLQFYPNIVSHSHPHWFNRQFCPFNLMHLWVPLIFVDLPTPLSIYSLLPVSSHQQQSSSTLLLLPRQSKILFTTCPPIHRPSIRSASLEKSSKQIQLTLSSSQVRGKVRVKLDCYYLLDHFVIADDDKEEAVVSVVQ